MFNQFFSKFSHDLAIDLGTVNSLVYVKGKGIILNEPSVVAINKKTGQILAIGKAAQKMVGKTPAHIVAVRPLVAGVVSDFEVTQEMLRYLISVSREKVFPLSLNTRAVIGIPCGVTEVEKKAVEDAAKNAGAREVYLVEEPIAAAIGARLPIQDAKGNFIVDIGGGTCEVTVISLGGTVVSKSLKVAGDKLNEDIINFAREEYKLLIGPRTAEKLKISIGAAYLENKNNNKSNEKLMPMRGRNLITGLPEEVMVGQLDIKRALEKSVKQIINEIKNTIEATPPELLADIMKDGIYLAGGGALLTGLDKLIAKETKLPVKIIEDPMTAVVRGAGIILESLDKYSNVLAKSQELEMPK